MKASECHTWGRGNSPTENKNKNNFLHLIDLEKQMMLHHFNPWKAAFSDEACLIYGKINQKYK